MVREVARDLLLPGEHQPRYQRCRLLLQSTFEVPVATKLGCDPWADRLTRSANVGQASADAVSRT